MERASTVDHDATKVDEHRSRAAGVAPQSGVAESSSLRNRQPDLTTGGKMTTTADLVIRNGSVYTADAAGSWSDAIAVRDGQIVALGSRNVAAATTVDTKVID